MTSNHHSRRGRPVRQRRIIVRGIRRDTPDTRKLARALIALAKARLEAEAELQAEREHVEPIPGRVDTGEGPPIEETES